MKSKLSHIRLLRAFHNAAARCFCTSSSLSAGESVAQILQSEFGPFRVDLRIRSFQVDTRSFETRKQLYNQMPETSATHVSKPLMEPEVKHGHANPHALGLESEHRHDNPHAQQLEVKHDHHNPHTLGLEFEHRHDKPHAQRLEASHDHHNPHAHGGHEVKHKHNNPHLQGLDSKQACHDTPNPHPQVAEQPGPCTKSSQDIIKLLIDRVNKQSWIALEQDMKNFGIEITPKEVAWVLKVLKNPWRAWELFKWVSCRPGYAHDSACYFVMIDLLGQHSDHSLLNDLLADMEKRKIRFSIATINKLIGIYATHDEIDKAEHYFLKLNQLGMQPTAYTYKCMLHAFAKAGKCEKALEIYRVMQKEQQPITIISYNILLDGLSRNGKAELAWNIFEEMKRCEHLVDVYTYTILARTYGHAGMVDKALELLEEMKQNRVEPNKHTYNTILDALAGSHDRLQDAIKLFKRMCMDGVYPDASSCQSILKVLCKGRQVGRSLELAQCIKEKVVKKKVCESFIMVLGKMGYLRDVRALFQSLKADNIQPSQATSLSMIDALCRGAEANEALCIMKETEEKGGPLPLSTYNAILAALRNGNQFQAAYDLFKYIKERGPSPDVVSYNIIIAGLAKMGKEPLAKSLLEEMIRSGCMPNVITFNSLLHSFARLADVRTTRKLLKMMHTKEVTPDVVTYNCTIECFRRAGKPKVALKVFEEMKEKGCSPSFVTYNNVLLALANAGMTDQVLSLFEEMKEQGFVPDAMTFTILRRFYDSNPQLDKNQLVEEIRNAGLAYELNV